MNDSIFFFGNENYIFFGIRMHVRIHECIKLYFYFFFFYENA